jgi:3-phenylpropionate/trans-cinnamate dioxygenase ferredoxin subunit
MRKQKTYRVAPVEKIPPGERLIFDMDGISVGVFHVNNQFYAIRNLCPHMGAPLCQGLLTDNITSDNPGEYKVDREGEILRCPWHGWEFDLLTGKALVEADRWRTKVYNVAVEEAPSVETYEVAETKGWVVIHR